MVRERGLLQSKSIPVETVPPKPLPSGIVRGFREPDQLLTGRKGAQWTHLLLSPQERNSNRSPGALESAGQDAVRSAGEDPGEGGQEDGAVQSGCAAFNEEGLSRDIYLNSKVVLSVSLHPELMAD
ncbi:hypothetical protein chiPu_0007624 [Chiloscyllium punctatum]|uniref:Uncharacterized protein n=1 Tax=Chiloscyllium punctatum TaxID=137246 RepID=A0A401SFK4_CHIPU|nr:hypothetical protein [Chiloscyllium punctatum]